MNSSSQIRSLLDQHRPASALKSLEGDLTPQETALKAEALFDLDRFEEAHKLLDPVVPQLKGDEFACAETLWTRMLLRAGQYDNAIISAQYAANAAQSEARRAEAIAWGAVGFSHKKCWNLAEAKIREAIEITPNALGVLIPQARLRLNADQRLQARAIYDRMADLGDTPSEIYANWGRAHIAYLMGEFDQASKLGETALSASDEIIYPLFTLFHIALAKEDLPTLERYVAEVEARSPQSDGLKWLKEEFDRLKARLNPSAAYKRLPAFPSLVQRRDHCGPSVIELVLRYWKGGLDLTNDQIAEKVKFPHSGTPIYRMREFFRLVGFDSIHCYANADKLKALIEAKFPVIIQEEFSNSSHVAVVIGHDDSAGTIEIQDPMTHSISSLKIDELNKLRRVYADSAIVAFPSNQGHDKTLARMGFFDEQPLNWTDQATLELDERRYQNASDLSARAAQKRNDFVYGWIIRLYAEMELWRQALDSSAAPAQGLAASMSRKKLEDPALARGRFYEVLNQAKKIHPEEEFVHQFEGRGALLDGDLKRALTSFERAIEKDPEDARNLASLAECQYGLRETEKAMESAWKSLQNDPTLPAANAWTAIAFAYHQRNHNDHYARVAADLAPDWWLSHLALAESFMSLDDDASARREAEIALSFSSGQSQARLVRALTLDDPAKSVAELEAILNETKTASPVVRFRAFRALTSMLYNARLYDSVIEQINLLLKEFPKDKWGVEFLANAQTQLFIQQGRVGDKEAIKESKILFERAVKINEGATWVIGEYARLLSALAGAKAAASKLAQLRKKYPDNGALVFLHGKYLVDSGKTKPAAQVMLEALGRDGIANPDELYDAVDAVLNGLGLEEGEKAVLEAPIHENGAPMPDRERALGLVLSEHREERGARAVELLTKAIEKDPEDAFALLRLGDAVETEEERESYYRRALMTAPRWTYARSHFAHYLIDQDRAEDALELTSGHENEGLNLAGAHGRALIRAARYDEAVATFQRVMEELDTPDEWIVGNKWFAERELGRHEDALASARKGLELFPDKPYWYTRIASSLRDLERFEEAEQIIGEGKSRGLSEHQALESEYEDAWAKKNYESALAAAEKLSALDKDKEEGDLSYWDKMRLRLLVELKRPDEARRLAESNALNAEGWGEAAWAILRADDYALSLEFAERSLALDPEDYSGLYTRAQTLEDMDRPDEAREAFYRLRDVHPDEHNSYEKLALSLAAKGENLDEAMEMADRAVEMGAFCVYAWANRGYVHFVRGERESALADLQVAWDRGDVDDRRRNYDYWWLLAELKGDKKLAQEYKAKAIEEAKTTQDRDMIAQIEKSF